MNRGTQRLLSAVAMTVTLTAGSVMVAPQASAGGLTLNQFFSTKSYPYAGYNGGNSPAGYSKGWCVDYGIWAWEHWTGTRFTHVKVANFKSTAINRGYKVGTAPRTGALAVWVQGGTHMAYVRSYKSGARSFTVREVRWNTTGPSDRSINKSDIANRNNRRGPDFFIYKK